MEFGVYGVEFEAHVCVIELNNELRVEISTLLSTDQHGLMDSVSLSAFLARRVLQGMVVPFPKDATQTRGADKLTRRALP